MTPHETDPQSACAVQAAHDGELSRMVADQGERLFTDIARNDVLSAFDAGVWSEAGWRAVVDVGMGEALLPSAAGGPGIAPSDALALMQRAAWHALPLPLAETMMARTLWAAAGGDGSGEHAGRPMTLATATDALPMRLRSDSSGWRLTGQLHAVPWANRCAALLSSGANDDGDPLLILLPLESRATRRNSNLAREPRDGLQFESLLLPAQAVRPAPWLAPLGLLPFGALLRANQMAGAMGRCLDHALRYANERVQFGRPIAQFPAVQDLLIEAAAQTSAASAAVALANARWPLTLEGRLAEPFLLACAIAKARAGEAAGIVSSACHQVHGAMGFTQEHPLHYSTRRLWSWRDECGNETFWQAEIGRWACAGSGDALWPALAAL